MSAMQTSMLLQRARQAHARNEMAKARRLCEQVLQRERNNAVALSILGQVAFAWNRLDEAISYMQRAIAARPNDPILHLGLAEVLTHRGQYEEAIAEFDLVLRKDPNSVPATAGKADAYEKSGRRDQARAVLEPFVARGREHALQAVIQARLDLHDRNYDAVVDLARRHLDGTQVPNIIRWHLCYHLGQALERLKRYDEAFAAYEKGNGTIPTHFDRDTWVQTVADTIESFSPQRFADVPRASHGSELPVFIVGMPRCGSTLVEIIIGAHPAAAAGGELPHLQLSVNSISIDIGSNLPFPACIEDLDQSDVDTMAGRYLERLREIDAGAIRIVDKYLNNYRHLGLLAVLFPQARFIHCRRDPLDTCLSCVLTPLSPATHPYASDLANVGTVYVGYEQLMAHWRDVLKIPMLEVPYEQLVADQEGHTRRIIDYCGLDWDDRCLRFYEGDRVVLTASYDQVNRPIYTSSLGRHRNFDSHLGPLKEALAEGGWTEARG